MISCYTDKLSVFPGERFALHAATDKGSCRLEIARVGAGRDVVTVKDNIAIGNHPMPPNADRDGCGWPVAVTVEVGDWKSGYYDIALTDSAGETAHHFVCVKARTKARAVLVLATNTLHAYNWWGGANAYCDVTSLMTGKLKMPDAMARGIGRLSSLRPFTQMLLAPPDDVPRLANARKRGFKEKSWAGENPEWSRTHGVSPYDASAGFLNRWEQAFVRWSEGEGLAFDYLTDRDLDSDPSALDGYECVFLVGHSEYWSGPQRDVIEAFVDRGGKLAIFSGNTAFWKVRWDGDTMVCHKWAGESAESVAPKDATHLWSHPMFARPEAEITGLSFIYGGYHRLGLCAARGIGGYTVYRNKHWALEACDLFYGDVIGDTIPLIGYENDGCLFEFDVDGLPAPLPGLGVPKNLEIIAFAPAAFAEPADNPYRPLIPPEQLGIVANIAYGSDNSAAQARVTRGHAVMASFKRGKGEVFNGGTTEWAHGLAANDPFVVQITRNVVKRFLP